MIKTSPVLSASFLWLTDTTTIDKYSPDVYSRYEVPMDKEIGNGWIEIFNLNLGMDLGHGVHYFTEAAFGQLMPLAEMTSSLTEPMLKIQSASSGQVLVNERRANKNLIFGKGLELFQYVDRQDFVPHLNCSEKIEVFSINIGRSALTLLLGEASANSLIKKLGLNQLNSATVQKIPIHISMILYNAINPQYKGDLQRIFIQSKIVEYLSALVVHFGYDNDISAPSLRRKQIEELHEELLNYEGKLPPLAELAYKYGVCSKTLNEEFKNQYGKPIYKFVNEHRLQLAHSALQASDIAMKVLADNLGYSHVNHFINAFKRKFSYTPGSLRKRGLQEN